MFSWLIGYKSEANTPSGVKNPSDEPLEKDKKEEEIKIDPPQKLEKVCQGKKDDVIYWADYEKQIKEIREDLNKLKIESDERWNKRLSPVMTNRELVESPKKKRKKNRTASGTENKNTA